ncbi:MAG: hypothetical protein JNL70_06700 [Saprospiraceae bacterium]|nr:hypothetical protein [Saprospiraceae bacterium]
MQNKNMEYMYMAIAALIIIMKLTQAERDWWDYFMILVGSGLISLSIYRLFIAKK